MFWKRPPPAEAEPFDEDSYIPEPTDHFGQSMNNMQKGSIGVVGTMIIYQIFRVFWQMHH